MTQKNKFFTLIDYLASNNHDFNVKHNDDDVSVRIWTYDNGVIIWLAEKDYIWQVIPYTFGLPLTPESLQVIIPKTKETDTDE